MTEVRRDRVHPPAPAPGRGDALTVATWNVNSLRKRLPQVLRLLEERPIDVLLVQEIKAAEADVPAEALVQAGLPHHALNVMPGYNGVGVFSRLPLSNVEHLDWCGQTDSRHVRATVAGIDVHCLYIPAGGDVPDPEKNPRFRHKLAFLEALTDWFDRAIDPEAPTLIAGDFNVAPLETDVWDTKKLRRVVTHTPVERESLGRLQASGPFIDAVRNFVPPEEKLFTWWTYRTRDWRTTNRGRRLDHIWVTAPLAPRLAALEVAEGLRDDPTPSDHVPVIVTLGGSPS